MPDSVSPGPSEDIPTLFFDRLTDDHGDLIHALAELAEQIDQQNLHGVLDALSAIESRIKGMRDISTVFDGYLYKHKQLMTSLNPVPKEDV